MSATRRARHVITVVRDYLPKGQTLPEDVWRVRHRTLTYLLRAHVVAIFVYALARGQDLLHAVVEAGVVAVFAVFTSNDARRRKVSSAMTAMGLVAASAVLVHVSGGLIEMHFHFFVMVGILTLYQDWLPFLAAIGFVVAHHGVMGTMNPTQVYNHPDAIAHPFKWALVHGAFVLAASAASIVAWRLNEEQALKDSLTRLPNRRLFQDRVGHAIARAHRHPRSLAVLFIDLDGFKAVNDSLGHAAGDQLLAAVADRIRVSVRPADTPARLGGDEFAVLVEDLLNDGDAARVADRLVDALSLPFSIRGKDVTIGASIGIAIAGSGDSVAELLRNADVAMYKAKSAGGAGYQIFESGMHVAVVDRFALEQDLQRAIEQGEFVVHYQPVVSLTTARIASLEALVRWNHPTRGLLPPAAFLDIAEQTGAIVSIGGWVLREACRQARVWQVRYPSHPFSLAVNLSPTQLHRPDIVEVVATALRDAGLAPKHLVLELTEGIMLDDNDTTLQRLNGLKALGVQLAVDDFGTGYSSLSYLRRLPIDILKIDKLFIDGLHDSDDDEHFARSIIALAQTLGLDTVAEGVEHADQAVKLRDLGCQHAQGYRFAKPLQPDGITALFGAADLGDGWLHTRSNAGSSTSR